MRIASAALLSRLGLVVGGIGTYVGPGALAVGAAIADDHAWTTWKYILTGTAAALPPLLVWLGARVRAGGLQKQAYENALRTLVTDLLKPDGHTQNSDPALPLFRATVFVPRAHFWQEDKLYPLLRMTSADVGKVLEAGEPGFEKTQPFDLTQPFVGQAYTSKREVYNVLQAVDDFTPAQVGATSQTEPDELHRLKYEAWQGQWNSFKAPRKPRSSYMQATRTIWAFPVPGRDQEKQPVIAVFSMDSVRRDAFRASANTPTNSLLLDLNEREAVAAVVASTVHAATGGSLFGLIRSLVRRNPTP